MGSYLATDTCFVALGTFRALTKLRSAANYLPNTSKVALDIIWLASAMLKLVNSKFRSCVKVKVAILGSPSLISFAVFVDVKQHSNKKAR